VRGSICERKLSWIKASRHCRSRSRRLRTWPGCAPVCRKFWKLFPRGT